MLIFLVGKSLVEIYRLCRMEINEMKIDKFNLSIYFSRIPFPIFFGWKYIDFVEWKLMK
jgi:hypothetical protein